MLIAVLKLRQVQGSVFFAFGHVFSLCYFQLLRRSVAEGGAHARGGTTGPASVVIDRHSTWSSKRASPQASLFRTCTAVFALSRPNAATAGASGYPAPLGPLHVTLSRMAATGLSQQQLAAMAGCSQPAIHKALKRGLLDFADGSIRPDRAAGPGSLAAMVFAATARLSGLPITARRSYPNAPPQASLVFPECRRHNATN
jgi:hypothetical protein